MKTLKNYLVLNPHFFTSIIEQFSARYFCNVFGCFQSQICFMKLIIETVISFDHFVVPILVFRLYDIEPRVEHLDKCVQHYFQYPTRKFPSSTEFREFRELKYKISISGIPVSFSGLSRDGKWPV